MYHIFPRCCYLFACLLRMLTVCQAALQPPSISFSSGYSTYLIGEPVSMHCQVPNGISVHGYRFYKDEQELQNLKGSHSNQFMINMVNMDNFGSYTCSYWLSNSRESLLSPHSSPVSITVMDQPTTPGLLLKPKQKLYFEGESATLVCDHPPINSRVSYKFHKDGKELLSHRDAQRSQLLFSSLKTQDSGTYDCQYWLLGHQRKIISSRSFSHTLAVTALSAAPQLIFHPSYSTYILGENVSMDCVAPSPVLVTLYRLYKEGREMVDSSNSPSVRRTLTNVTKEDEGHYTCMYWSPKSEREIPSIQSVAREIYIIAPLHPPLLSLDPPNGRVWDGGNVTLLCSVPTPYEKTTFHFHYLNDNEETVREFNNTKETRKAVTITVWKGNNTSKFKYSCQYTANIKGRFILSPTSSQAEVTVITGSYLWIIVFGVVAGIVVLIVMIGLLFWVLKARKDSSKGDAESKPSSEDDDKFSSKRTQDES